jgi:hypothetical protein
MKSKKSSENHLETRLVDIEVVSAKEAMVGDLVVLY